MTDDDVAKPSSGPHADPKRPENAPREASTTAPAAPDAFTQMLEADPRFTLVKPSGKAFNHWRASPCAGQALIASMLAS